MKIFTLLANCRRPAIILLLMLFCLIKSKIAFTQTDYTIGTTSGTNSNTTYPAPLPDWYEGSRQQYLFRASELTAAGMSAGNITAIKWNVTALNGAGVIENYTIKIGATATTTLGTTTWDAPTLSTVYGSSNYSPVSGINIFTFSTPFAWNGTSNILIDICEGQIPANGGNYYSANASVAYTSLAFNASRLYAVDDLTSTACSYAGTSQGGSATQNSTRRPVTTFSLVIPCSGTPTAGSASANTSSFTCSGSTTISLTGASTNSGISYQWQSSTASSTGPWTDITSATNPTYTTPTLTSTTYYRCVLKCTNSGLTANSAAVTVTINSPAGGNATAGTSSFTCSGSTTISLNSYTSTGTTLQWQSSTDGGANWNNIAQTGSNFNTGTLNSTTSYRCIVTCTASSLTSTSSVATVTINTAVNGGTASASTSLFTCSGSTTVSLNSGTYSTGTGITYQWQSSTDGGANWNNIAQTGTSFTTPTLTATTSYRCIVNCTSGGTTSTSSVATVTINTAVNGGTASASTSSFTCSGSTTVSLNSGTYSTGTGITYQWQSSTDGGANWNNIAQTGTSFTTGTLTATTSYRCIVNCTSGGTTATSSVATVTINTAVNGGTASASTSSFTCSGSTTVSLNSGTYSTGTGITYQWQSSTDGGANWNNIAQTGTSFTTGTLTATTSYRCIVNCTSGGTTATSSVATVTIGSPTGGTVSASPTSVCYGSSSTISISTGTTTGINNQWQSSPDNTTFTDITGATGITYAASPTTSTYYRRKVSCTANTSNFVYSGSVQVTVTNPPYATFNGTLFTESFENWVSSCGTTDAPTANWRNIPYTGDNSWRRDDQGNSAGWANRASGIYSPVYTDVAHSARFHTYNAANGSTGNLDLFINMAAATGSTQFTFDYINTGGGDVLKVYESTDGGTNFTQLGSTLTTTGTGSTWTTETFTVTGTSATTVIRLQATSDFGGSDIGVDNCVLTGPCTGTPTAGTASAATSSYTCSGTPTISSSGASSGLGISYQWYSSTDNVTFNPITGATGLSYTPASALTVTTYFKCVVTCSTSGLTATTNTVTITIGAPTGGAVSASPTSVCYGSSSTISISTGTTTGINNQWQSSPDNTTFTDIVGATGTTYAASPTTNTYYRRKVICTANASNFVYSGSVQVTVTNPPYATFNGTLFTESFENWVSSCGTTDAPTANWRNIPYTGDNSWRRDDQGASAGWTNRNNGIYSPVFTDVAHSARFHSYNAANGSIGNLDLFINMTAATGSTQLTFDYINTNGTDVLKVYESTDGGNSFVQLGATLGTAGAWTTETFTVTGTSATTIIRLQATSDDGTTDIGVDNCVLASPCTGTPTGGTALATPASGTPGSTFTASVSGATIAAGLTYQWQSSPDNSSWTDVAGATSVTSIITSVSAVTTTYYRLKITCTNTGLFAFSTATTYTTTYCTPTTSSGQTRSSITLVEFVGTLNDVSNPQSATTAAYEDFTGRTPAKQEQGEAVNLNVSASTVSCVWAAWVDWNQDGDFDDVGEQVYNTTPYGALSTSFGFQIPLATPAGNYRIRIRTSLTTNLSPCNNQSEGQTEDYVFTVIARCNARIASIVSDDECSSVGTSTNFVMSAVGTTGTTGFNWYTAQTGGTPVSNSGNTTFTATPSPSGTFNVTTNNTTTYWVTATNASCESPSRVPVIASFRPIPSAITFMPSNPAYLCSGSSLQVSGGSSTETDYLIKEGFESTANPLGEFTVTTANNTNAQQQWQLRTSTFTPTTTAVWRPAISSGFGADRFVTALGNDVSSNIMATTLTSSAHNTNGYTNLTLDFKIYYDHYLADNNTTYTDNITVQAYDGTTWSNLQQSSADIGKASNMATLTYILGAQYLNKTNMQVRFIYNAQLNGSDGVALDSVRLYGDHPTTGNYVWTQTGGLVDNCLYLDAAFTMPYMSGTPATKVYLRPTNLQQEDGTPLVFKADLSLSNGCTASGNLTVNIDNKRWIGGSSNDWNDGSNWCGGAPPVISDRVTIPNLSATGGNYPVIKNTPLAKSRFLTIDPGASVTVNEGYTLQVRRDLYTDVGATFTNNGTLALVGQNAGSDNNNHDPQNFPGPGTVAEMNNLVIGNTTNVVSTGGIHVQLNAPISLRGRLRDSAGILALGNYDITLKSRVTSTAYVDVVESGYGFNYNGAGRFIVERYFPPVRAWRFIAVPFSSSSQTINDAWQEGNVYCDYSSCSSSTWNGTPGYGTEITYNNICGAGFDYHNNNYKTSIQTYQNNAWVTPGSTYSNFVSTPSSSNPGSPGYPAYALFVRGDRTVCLSYEAPSVITTLRPKGILNEDGNNVSHALPPGNAGDYILIGNPYACTIKLDDALFNRSSSNINKNNFWTYNPNAGTTGGYVTYSLTGGTNVPYVGTPTPYIQSGQAFMVQLKTAGTPTFDFLQSDKLPGQAQVNSGVFGLQAAQTEQKPSLVYTNLIDTSNAVLDGVAAAFDNQYSAAVDDIDASKKWNEEIENMAIIRHDTALAIEFRPLPKTSDTVFFRLYLRQHPYRLKVFSQNLVPAFSSKAWIVDKYLGTETEVNLRDTSIYDFTPNSDTMSYRNRFELVFSPAKTDRVVKVDSLIRIIIAHIYPNPVSGRIFRLVLDNARKDDYTVNIYTMKGSLAATRKVSGKEGTSSWTIPVPLTLTSGNYTVQVLNSSGVIVSALPLVVNR